MQFVTEKEINPLVLWLHVPPAHCWASGASSTHTSQQFPARIWAVFPEEGRMLTGEEAL